LRSEKERKKVAVNCGWREKEELAAVNRAKKAAKNVQRLVDIAADTAMLGQ
jgi:hypothetical protein